MPMISRRNARATTSASCRTAGWTRSSTSSAVPPVEAFRSTPPAVRIVHGLGDQHVPARGGVGRQALEAFDYPSIFRTESWWRGMGATISARYEPTRGHEWMPNEAQREWSWFRGVRL